MAGHSHSTAHSDGRYCRKNFFGVPNAVAECSLNSLQARVIIFLR